MDTENIFSEDVWLDFDITLETESYKEYYHQVF